MNTAEQTIPAEATKLPKETIAFKHGASIKTRVSEIAKEATYLKRLWSDLFLMQGWKPCTV